MSIEKITLGGGCFWCIENIFKRVKGVINVTSGYSAGDNINPTYQQVCSGETNHAEVVQIEFDNKLLNLGTILTVFFAIHDPTTLNRQGDDIGSQYRSIVLYRNDQQKHIAIDKIASLGQAGNVDGSFDDKIVTEIKQFEQFYSAESYHQDYFENNQDNQYCQLVVAKKIQRFLADFSHLLKTE
jgi:peptide-methionine (S)-S-oxide reductase